MAQAEGMDMEEGEVRNEDIDEDADTYAPDENLPQTKEAEDEELLAACDQGAKEEKLRYHSAKDEASGEKGAAVYNRVYAHNMQPSVRTDARDLRK